MPISGAPSLFFNLVRVRGKSGRVREEGKGSLGWRVIQGGSGGKYGPGGVSAGRRRRLDNSFQGLKFPPSSLRIVRM